MTVKESECESFALSTSRNKPIFSRQFRALAILSLLWALPWALLGVIVALTRWSFAFDASFHPSFLQILAGHAFMYGAIGGLSGLIGGIAIAQVERGRSIDHLQPGRLFWLGLLGGSFPVLMFVIGAVSNGASLTPFFPVIMAGAVSAVASGAFAVGALHTARLATIRSNHEISTGANI